MMQDSGVPTGDESEDSGIVAEPVTKSASKQPSGATNTDSNPDKV